MSRMIRWWRFRRHLSAEVSRRERQGYPVSGRRLEELREEARARAGY